MVKGRFAEAMKTAENCTECGECEAKCPYHLPIRESIKDKAKIYAEFRRAHIR